MREVEKKGVIEDYRDEKCACWKVVEIRFSLTLILKAAQGLSLKPNLLFAHLRHEASISF